MSKSLGNVFDPFSLLESYPSEVIRTFFAFEGPEDFDADFDPESIPNHYNTFVEGFSKKMLKF